MIDGQDMDLNLLLYACSQDTFSIADEDGGIYGYDPGPYAVLSLEAFLMPRSLVRRLPQGGFEGGYDTAWLVPITITVMGLARLAALIMPPAQVINHFLFYNLLYQPFHPQLYRIAGNIRLALKTTFEYLHDLMAYFPTWWYPLHDVRVPFFPTSGFLDRSHFISRRFLLSGLY